MCMQEKMAVVLMCAARLLFLFLLNSIVVSCGSGNRPVQNVPEPLIQSALNSLNEDSPTHHTYKGGNLISAQKLDESPYVIYRLTFDLTPVCKESLEPCPREACTVEVKQHERGDINVLRESIQCMYLYPQLPQDEPSHAQENQEHEIIENLEKQIITNQSVELDHEIQKTGEHNEKPFIAMRASSPNYCPGCPYELNPNLPGLAAFGEQAAKSMDEFVRNDYKHKAVEIIKVTRAVPPSSNVIQYRILLLIGESDCLKNAIEQNTECSVQESLPIKTCLITFEEQPWQQLSRRITKNNCTVSNSIESKIDPYSTLGVESLVTPAPKKQEVDPAKAQALENLKNILDNYTNAATAKVEEQQRPEVTEHPMVKVSLNRSDDDTKPQGFEDKLKEFTEFVKDFDLPVREAKSSPETNREEVIEESIIPKKASADPTTNENLQRNRRTLGGPKKIDVNDPEIQEAASKGLKKLSEGYRGTNEPIITEIVEASKQIVSGTLYKIKAKVGSSTCAKGAKENCKLQEGSEIQKCLFSIWSQPWIDNGSPEIKIDCNLHSQQKRSLHGDELLISNERFKREAPIVGAPSTADINDPEIQEAANQGLQKLSESYRGTNEPIITEIVEASKQIVSGILYKIKTRVGSSTCAKGAKENCKLQEGSEIQECLFSIWSQPWIDNGSPEIKINCNLHSQQKRSLHGDELFVSNERFKRKSGIPGAPHNADVNDPEILEAANKGLKKLSESYQGTTEPIITEIVEASKQTVSGTLYKIKAKVGPSSCPKGVKDNCQLQEGSEIQECLFSVWSQPWVDKGSAEITVNCNLQHQKKRSIHGDELLTFDERFKRELPIRGGPQAADINDPEIQEAANKSLKKFSESYEDAHEPIITEIVEASKQTVSGTLYKIKAKIGRSTCAKGAKENCKLQEESEIQECLFSIWSQPWIDHGSPEIEINCNERNQQESPRTKRKSDMDGAPVRKLANDPEIKNLAKKGLEKFSENSEGTHEPMIVEIVEASKQVVSGLLYKIKVKLGTSTCPRGVKGECKLKEGSDIKVCLFTIWSQPWIDNGSPEITINCDLANRRKRSLRGVDYNNKMLKIAEEAATDIKEQYMFEKFIKEYEKTYSSAEEKQSRYEIFKKNLEVIQEMREAEQGTAKYGVTMFADLTPKEFRSKYLGYRPHLKQENAIPFPEAEIPDIELPPKFDWRDHHVVTPVKDQGQCGSCWAFSVTGNVESQYAIKHGKLLSLSEQELVDCDTLDLGCGGGEMDNAYTTIEKLGGLELETDYPYDARNEKCEFNKGKAVVNVVDALHISSNETKMAQWLVKNGPISIAINANAMQFYMGGVSHPLKFLCNPKDLDHGVLIVGYGTSVYPIFKKVKPYWIIKNSWGPRWGEQGYYRVYRGDGTCGLNKTPSSAIVA